MKNISIENSELHPVITAAGSTNALQTRDQTEQVTREWPIQNFAESLTALAKPEGSDAMSTAVSRESQNCQSISTAKNEYRIDGDVVRIKLTQGKETCVDLTDFDKVKNHAWWAEKSQTGPFYATARINRQRVFLQNYLMERTRINHRDADSLNNRRSNLRVATSAQSSWNRPKNKNNTSGYKGVSHRHTGKWVANIGVTGRKLFLGRFDDAAAAARAYDEAAKKYHGEFAFLNFPDEKYSNN